MATTDTVPVVFSHSIIVVVSVLVTQWRYTDVHVCFKAVV